VNYDSGKEVFPAGGAGRYEAMIMFNNRADSALEDVIIHDIIPGAFDLVEWKVTSSGGGIVKCDMDEEATTDGKKMSWKIGTVGRGERIEVTYEFKGDPDAGFKVSDAQEIHGIDVGAEIEDDEPPEAMPMTDSEPEEEVEEEAAEEEVEEEAAEEEVEEEAAEEEVEEEAAEEEVEEESSDGEEDDEMDAALAKLTGGGSSSESDSDSSEARSCTICNAEVEAGMTQCPVCSFTF
jgi:rubrerythrin